MTQDMHTLTGPYALNALPEAEAEAFELHLVGCATCRAEVHEFRETAAHLADAAAVAPPTSLKDAVMAEVAATRQDAPRVVALHSRAGRTRTGPLQRWALPAAAAIAMIAIGLGVALGSLNGRVNDLQAREQVIAALLASDDVVVAHGTGEGATASVVASPSRGEAVITFTNLGPAPANHVYELWMIGDQGPIPAGLFHVDADGRAVAIMRGDVAATHAVAVTVEPAGGSDAPTTVPFLAVSLTA